MAYCRSSSASSASASSLAPRLGFTVITAAIVLSCWYSVVIIATREAIRAVPQSIRQASYALGATKWQTVSRQVLPSAVPGIATGSILALSRAIGEAAPLIVLGAVTFITFNPDGLDSGYTALPIQIYTFITRSQLVHRCCAIVCCPSCWL
jgi:phosphate transport system permease protein